MADARSDFIFKKVMSRKRICKHLPEELLQIEIADIKCFYDYVNKHIVTTDFTKQIDDEISYLKLDMKVRREFILMEARLLDERRKGIAEGKEIGLAKEKLATAKRLFSVGLSVQDVAKATSLPLEQVQALQAELSCE